MFRHVDVNRREKPSNLAGLSAKCKRPRFSDSTEKKSRSFKMKNDLSLGRREMFSMLSRDSQPRPTFAASLIKLWSARYLHFADGECIVSVC